MQRVRRLGIALTLAVLALAGCGPKPPLKIGFIAGMSGPVADLGSAGRNGALLAVELRNASGGIGGRHVELLMRDDRQESDVAVLALRELDAAGVEAVAGPMTSLIGEALAPVATQLGIVLVGGTVATPTLSGRDDHFFRVIGSTTLYAARSAELARSALRSTTAVIVADRVNSEYSAHWSSDFGQAFERGGGRVLDRIEFDSREPTDFGPLVDRIARLRPEVLVLATSPRDAGLLGRRVRQPLPAVALLGAGWSAAPRLMDMGGAAVEGMLVEQYYDLDSKADLWIAMNIAYRERFGVPADYAALAGFEAANVILVALERGARRSTMKQALLAGGELPGTHVPVRFDAFGDSARELFFSKVTRGAFATLR
jgi:branched-chain amino acid transport system substrate-binding protein